ncbi:XRE family transcriptional regulator [Xenophilus aerolatus]|nr:XRE family transcriptional regulator [Xenophilus aerolatus]
MRLADISEGSGPTNRLALGSRLRSLRKQQGRTLKELAKRSGVALSTLSKVELGQVAASYEKLLNIASALDIDISSLFEFQGGEVAPRTRSPVVRSTLGAAPRYDGEEYDYQVLAGNFPHRRMTPLHARIVVRAGQAAPKFVRHPGQEFVMVLTGSVQIAFETGQVLELGPTDSAYFDSSVGHAYGSVGRKPAKVVIVMSGPDGKPTSSDHPPPRPG